MANQEEFYGELLERIKNIEGYNKKDIRNVLRLEWLRKQPAIQIIKTPENFIKYLYNPFTNKEITELDGAIVIKNSKTGQKTLVIVEGKHHATRDEIEKKSNQISDLRNWIDEEKKYYHASKSYQQCIDQQRQIKNELKGLRRRIRRGNAGSNVNNIMENKNQTLWRLVEFEPQLEDELDQEIEKNNWHKNFVKTLQNHNLQFDKFALFFGAPIWEKDEYKSDLLKQNIGVIEVSGNRYQVKPEKITDDWLFNAYPIIRADADVIYEYEENASFIRRILEEFALLKPEFAIDVVDPKSLVVRPMFSDDFLIKIWKTSYWDNYKTKWEGNRKVMTIKRVSKSPSLSQLQQIKNIVVKVKNQNRAASQIQKAYRAWIWRKKNLWNPATEIGMLNLKIRAQTICHNC